MKMCITVREMGDGGGGRRRTRQIDRRVRDGIGGGRGRGGGGVDRRHDEEQVTKTTQDDMHGRGTRKLTTVG